MKLTTLIYVGRCLTTNKVYVGSTRKGKRRPLGHVLLLNKKQHTNSYLQRAWDKYGADSFVWHIVEQCDEKNLVAREQWWVGFMRALDRRYGYNLCNPVGFSDGVKSQLSKTQVRQWQDPEIRRKRLTGFKASHKSKKWKSRRAKAMAANWQNPVWRAKMLKVLRKNSDDMAYRMKKDPGFKRHRMRGIQL
jgi:group I intron endonuclease